MARKILALLLCFLLLISFCSCSKSDDKTTNSNVSTPVVSDTSTAQPEAKPVYLVDDSSGNLICIELPSNILDDSKIEFISAFVADELYEYTGEEFNLTKADAAIKMDYDNYSNYYIDVKSEISFISDDVVSIIFFGELTFKNAPHPNQTFFTLNFDPNTMNIVNFADLYVIDDKLYDNFAEYAKQQIIEENGGVAPDWLGNFSETLCSKETFVAGLNDEPYYSLHWYLTEDGVGFSYSVQHAIGDYKTVELPYDILN